MRNGFIQYIFFVNSKKRTLILRLLLYIFAISYLFYQLLSGLSTKDFISAFFIVLLLTLIPFFQISVWLPIKKQMQWIKQNYPWSDVWLAINIYSALLAIVSCLLILLTLIFFGFEVQLNPSSLLILILGILALNAVVQFVFSITLEIADNNALWLFLIVIPLITPILLTAKSSWIKRTGNNPFKNETLYQQEDLWLLGLWLIFTSASYLLFERIWKN